MTLNPLSFREFLTACGEEMLLEWCEKHFSEEIPELMAEKFTDYLKKYMVIGGMPSVVNVWLETGDYGLVTEEQRRLLLSYENDFSKHAPQSIVPKIHHVWNSIPSQLAKENKKFIYGLAKEGARAREYEDALMWLKDSGVIRRIGCVKSGKLPLKAYEDLKSFKIYHLDVGLLRTLCEIDATIIIEPEAVFREFSGTLTEQFVLQELTSLEIAPSIYYWTEGAMAEVDFIFAYKNMVIPVEAKAGLNVHAQSLKSFRQKYNPKVSIRTSLKGFKVDDGLYNVPLYMLWNLEKMI
jgi:hypothetical protein